MSSDDTTFCVNSGFEVINSDTDDETAIDDDDDEDDDEEDKEDEDNEEDITCPTEFVGANGSKLGHANDAAAAADDRPSSRSISDSNSCSCASSARACMHTRTTRRTVKGESMMGRGEPAALHSALVLVFELALASALELALLDTLALAFTLLLTRATPESSP